MLLAHAQPAALAAAIAIGAARHLTSSPAVAYGCAVAAVLLAFGADHYHENQLCPRCAAAMPTDGAAVAQRHRRWLRLHHWATERVGYALILLIGPAVAALAGPGAPWIIYPAYVAWALVAYANLRHRPVEPWCPHCRAGTGTGTGKPTRCRPRRQRPGRLRDPAGLSADAAGRPRGNDEE